MNYKTTRKRVSSLKPSPENERLYRPVDHDDPEVVDLAASIDREGLHNPLIITADGYVVSGHRRLAALQLNGQKQAPCRVLDVRRRDMSRDDYVSLLRDHNRQRHKSVAEQVRETLVDIDPADAWASLSRRRIESVERDLWEGDVEHLQIDRGKRRHGIRREKADHVEHINAVVFQDLRAYWPLSVRTVHYALLNYDFERNTRLQLRYKNDDKCYASTSDLLTRLRISEGIPWAAITDGTRPHKLYHPFDDVKHYVRQEVNSLFAGYWRNLLQSQPNHVEVLVEKNTVFHMAQKVTRKYQIPTSSGRGFDSIDAVHEIASRYEASEKERLILIVLSDYDPEGERIPQAVGQSLQRDFGIPSHRCTLIKAGVTRDQIDQYDLPPQNFAKESSSNFDWFVQRTGGETVYELEALRPADMLQDLETTIQSVLDMELFQGEREREREEATYLESVRRTATEAIRGLDQ